MDDERHLASETQIAVVTERVAGRRGRLRTYVFEAAVAAVWAIYGTAYLLHPGRVAAHSVLGIRVFPWDYAWSIGYIAAAVMILAGIWIPQLRVRVVGLLVMGTGLTLQAIAAWDVAPQLRDVNFVIFAVACFVRVSLLSKLWRQYESLQRGGRDVDASLAPEA